MTTLNRKELLIHGFIREIENSLQNDRIIPNGLIQICFLFYSVSFKLFVSTKSNLYIANIDKQTISNLVNKSKTNINKGLISSCYIPDISRYIPLQNKQYDGIIGIVDSMTFRYHAFNIFILSFESNKIEEEYIEYSLNISSNTLPDNDSISFSRPHLTYCNEHGIMYSNSGIQQLKWENMDIESGKFKVNSIKSTINAINESCCSLGYIHNKHKIFVMEGISINEVLTISMTDYSKRTLKTKKCGIFDLTTKQWTEVKDFQYTTYGDNDSFENGLVGICQRNEYDVNGVYVVSNMFHAGKYDINKNEWEMLLDVMDNEKIHFYSKPIVWMDGNSHILYCHNASYNYSYFGCLDVRDNKKTWNTNDAMQFILDSTSKKNKKCTIFL